MTKVQRLGVTLLALLFLVLLVAYMAGMLTEQVAPGVDPLPGPVPDTGLTVTASEEALTETVPGTVQARETTLVAARLLARMTSLKVRPGETVQAGQVIATLEKQDLDARLRQVKEQIRGVDARLAEAKSALERARSLRDQKLIAQAELDNAEANYASLTAERAGLEQAVSEAETALSWANITAPISGRVVERLAEPGDIVSPGQGIVSIYNPATLRVEAWVREQLAVSLAIGDPLQIKIPAVNYEADVTIEEIVPAADSGSRSFLVRLLLDKQGNLLPGMYAQVAVPAGTSPMIRIPARYIRQVGQLDVVWVNSKAGAERRFIRVGDSNSDGVAVVAGLEVGEQLLEPAHSVGIGIDN